MDEENRDLLLARAQVVLDRCDGNLKYALSMAHFRRAIIQLLISSWPAMVEDVVARHRKQGRRRKWMG